MANSTPDTAEAKIREILSAFDTDDFFSGRSAIDEAVAQLKELLVDAQKEAVKPFSERLGRWLQPELMQMFVFEDMDRPVLLATCARYADWLLELDEIALQQTRQEEERE